MAAPCIIRPRPLRWYHRGLTRVLWAAIKCLAWTIRVRVSWPESLATIPADQPLIICVWHNRLSLSLVLYALFVRKRHRAHRLAALVSASRDGSILARILEHFGAQPVRGSSSRRGPQALLELTGWAERGYDLAITPDGPRGPRYAIQNGIIALAQLTGLPILPASYHLPWKWQLRSWDRFQIPLPFSRCDLRFGDPFLVPRTASEEERDKICADLQECMARLGRD